MNSIKVDVTKEAQDQVRELIKNQEPGTAVRVYLELGGGGGCGCGSGGGCGCGGGSGHGGPRFGMAFDQQKSGDHIVKVDGFSLLVDDDSAEMLDGAQIDFVQSLDQTGFRINAPKLQSAEGHDEHPEPAGPGSSAEGGGGCGCGSGGCGCG
ncbi:MAG: iron-sulfur cluster biosynthesis family protein [Thermoplasmata archaeon]